MSSCIYPPPWQPHSFLPPSLPPSSLPKRLWSKILYCEPPLPLQCLSACCQLQLFLPRHIRSQSLNRSWWNLSPSYVGSGMRAKDFCIVCLFWINLERVLCIHCMLKLNTCLRISVYEHAVMHDYIESVRTTWGLGVCASFVQVHDSLFNSSGRQTLMKVKRIHPSFFWPNHPTRSALSQPCSPVPLTPRTESKPGSLSWMQRLHNGAGSEDA